MDLFNDEFSALDSISRQIDITILKLDKTVKKLSEKDTEFFIQEFSKKYCNGNIEYYLWEGICKSVNEVRMECVAVANNDAWKWISEFVSDNVILFFNPEDEKVSYQFADTQDLMDVLSECYSFEFYIVNNNLDYVLCFNHHNILYACGTAINWLRKYKTPEYDRFSKIK